MKQSKKNILARYKGGKGSGWFAPPRGTHVGQSALRPEVEVVGYVREAHRDVVFEEIDRIPLGVREGIEKIELRAGQGKTFVLAGRRLVTGGEWTADTQKLTVYNLNPARSVENVRAHTRYLISHEVGHSLWNRWSDDAWAEQRRVRNEHPSWFKKDGDPRKKYIAEARKAMPLNVLRDEWRLRWRAGEDGITEYSRAWAVAHFHSTETFAELTRLHYQESPGRAKRDARASNAEGLHAVFSKLLEYYGG